MCYTLVVKNQFTCTCPLQQQRVYLGLKHQVTYTVFIMGGGQNPPEGVSHSTFAILVQGASHEAVNGVYVDRGTTSAAHREWHRLNKRDGTPVSMSISFTGYGWQFGDNASDTVLYVSNIANADTTLPPLEATAWVAMFTGEHGFPPVSPTLQFAAVLPAVSGTQESQVNVTGTSSTPENVTESFGGINSVPAGNVDSGHQHEEARHPENTAGLSEIFG